MLACVQERYMTVSSQEDLGGNQGQAAKDF